jgi:hypothetical protein
MRLDLGGHPIHTRALSVSLTALPRRRLAATADLVDLRKRGFTPVGSELQGAGVIHQMGLDAVLDGTTLVLEQIAERLPVVAFEASPSTRGESCRDVSGRLAVLIGRRVDDAALRDTIGGALGCSHVLALAQLLLATAAGAAPIAELGPAEAAPQRLFRRDLIFDGTEPEAGTLLVGIQLSDLRSRPAPATAPPAARFASHDERRLELELRGWPATIAAIRGAQRRRTPASFADAAWEDCGALLAPLQGLSLGKGANRELGRCLNDHPPWRDAMSMLIPALIQCRASFPDKWLNAAATTAGHPGLIGMPDSCYMWRRGGALERVRAARGG